MELIKKPDDSLSFAEKWLYYKRIENEAKNGLAEIAKEAFLQVDTNGGFYSGANGKIQKVNKTNKKAKESLKTLLAEKGVLELCQKDEIDLKKVESMVEAGIVTQEEYDEHVSTISAPYLKIGK